MKNMKVSIAMCTYFGKAYLREQLESIASQSYLPYELVVCDDCSEDGTIDILNTFSKESPFPVRIYINETNIRSTKNFEKAISLCEGDIIACSDQDDVWDARKIEKTVNVFNSDPNVGVVFTNAAVVDDNLKPLGYSLWESIKFNEKEQEMILKNRATEVLLKHNVVTGATMAFKKEFVQYFSPIPKSWVHDGWISLIISAYAKLAFIDAPLMKYRQHPNQQIGALKKDIKLDIDIALKNNEESYIKEMNHYLEAYERFKVLIHSEKDDSIIKLIDSKVNHLRIRSNMPKRKYKRIIPIISELAGCKYHKFSNGFLSAVKDFTVKK